MKTLEMIKKTADEKLSLIGLSELHMEKLEDGNKVDWLEQFFQLNLEKIKVNYEKEQKWNLANAAFDFMCFLELEKLRWSRKTNTAVLTFSEYEEELDPGCLFQDWFFETGHNDEEENITEKESRRLFFEKVEQFGYVNELKSVKEKLEINSEGEIPEEKASLVRRNLFERLEGKLEEKRDDLLADIVLQVEKILKETDQELLMVSKIV